MEEKFHESQKNLTSLKIYLKQVKEIYKKYSQILVETSKTKLEFPKAEGLYPTKEHGVPYFSKKLVDFIMNMQDLLGKYGLSMRENIDFINKLIAEISKTKKNHSFLFEGCKKRLNHTQSELEEVRKRHSSKSKLKSSADFDNNIEQNLIDSKNGNMQKNEFKSKILSSHLEDLQRKEGALYESLKAADSLIRREVDECIAESIQLNKTVIESLGSNFQQLSLKNIRLFNNLKKKNEELLGVEKLDHALSVMTSKISESSFKEESVQKPPLITKPPKNISASPHSVLLQTPKTKIALETPKKISEKKFERNNLSQEKKIEEILEDLNKEENSVLHQSPDKSKIKKSRNVSPIRNEEVFEGISTKLSKQKTPTQKSFSLSPHQKSIERSPPIPISSTKGIQSKLNSFRKQQEMNMSLNLNKEQLIEETSMLDPVYEKERMDEESLLKNSNRKDFSLVRQSNQKIDRQSLSNSNIRKKDMIEENLSLNKKKDGVQTRSRSLKKTTAKLGIYYQNEDMPEKIRDFQNSFLKEDDEIVFEGKVRLMRNHKK